MDSSCGTTSAGASRSSRLPTRGSCSTAVAAATERIRLGPMVTPPARRRPAKLARETATLDQLSNGRLVLGVGIGSDDFGAEYSRFGEETDSATRAAMTDETLEILRTAGAANRSAITGRITSSTTSRFCRDPFSVQASPCGSRDFRARCGRCVEPPATTASSRSISVARTISLTRSPPSMRCAIRRRDRSTSPSR